MILSYSWKWQHLRKEKCGTQRKIKSWWSSSDYMDPVNGSPSPPRSRIVLESNVGRGGPISWTPCSKIKANGASKKVSWFSCSSVTASIKTNGQEFRIFWRGVTTARLKTTGISTSSPKKKSSNKFWRITSACSSNMTRSSQNQSKRTLTVTSLKIDQASICRIKFYIFWWGKRRASTSDISKTKER